MAELTASDVAEAKARFDLVAECQRRLADARAAVLFYERAAAIIAAERDSFMAELAARAGFGPGEAYKVDLATGSITADPEGT